MENKCLAGIHKKTGVVEIIASLKSHVAEHIQKIEDSGCYPVIGDTALVKEAFGKKIDSHRDLLRASRLVKGLPHRERITEK